MSLNFEDALRIEARLTVLQLALTAAAVGSRAVRTAVLKALDDPTAAAGSQIGPYIEGASDDLRQAIVGALLARGIDPND